MASVLSPALTGRGSNSLSLGFELHRFPTHCNSYSIQEDTGVNLDILELLSGHYCLLVVCWLSTLQIDMVQLVERQRCQCMLCQYYRGVSIAKVTTVSSEQPLTLTAPVVRLLVTL